MQNAAKPFHRATQPVATASKIFRSALHDVLYLESQSNLNGCI